MSKQNIKSDFITILKVLGLFLGYVLIIFFMGMITAMGKTISRTAYSPLKDLPIILVVFGGTLIYILLARKLKLLSLRTTLNWQGTAILISTCVILILLIIYCWHLYTVGPHITPTTNSRIYSSLFENIPLWLNILISSLCLPIIEEIIYRGAIIGLLFDKHKYLGIIVSTIIFMLVHGSIDINGWVVYGLPGLLLSLSYVYSKDLKVPMIIHIAYNLVGFI